MALPTDPAKLAAYRARKAANQRAYVARQKAARAATPPPNVTGRYQQSRKPEYVPGTGNVERAHREVLAARQRRLDVVGSLPDIRNPAVTIRVPRLENTALNVPDRRTREGMERFAKRLRDNEKSRKLTALGKERQTQLRTELEHGPLADQLQEAMDRLQQDRFQKASERIAKASQQALGILFNHLEGASTYNSVLEKLIYPKGDDVEESLERLEGLADQAEKAERAYSPKAIGRLRV